MSVDYLSAINSSGSGLNITQIVDSLVDAEKSPQESIIQNKIDKKNTSISAIGEIKSALSVLSSSLASLKGHTSLKPTSTGSSISALITDPAIAKSINSNISVSSIAKGQTLAFEDYTSSTSIIGAGTLVLEQGDWSSGSFVASPTTASTSLVVTATDTLESLKDKINNLNYGVTASVLGAGDDTFTLVIKSGEGKKNALRINATESPSGSGLSVIDNTSTNASKQKVAGADATLTVDGISLTRSTNNISDLFNGYQIEIASVTNSSGTDIPINLTSSVDETKATENVQSFVDAVNKVRQVLNEKTFRGSASEKAGDLADDPVIKNIKNQIEKLTSNGLTGFSSDSVYISNLGVRTERDGKLSLDTTVLKNELKNNPSTLDSIFNSMYSSNSSLLTVSGGISKPPVSGSYTFEMTAFVSGAFTGLASNDTSPEVTASNNTIQITVDGTQSGSVTIPAAHYSSEAALATAIQTAVNSDSALTSSGKTVIVTHTNGNYSITSGSTGSATSIVLNAIGSNLNGFLKMSGTADTDAIATSQSGTASSALNLVGSFDDSVGKRISISSAGGNESGYTFTVVGTDLSGNAQTEVITGPAANATAIGSKTFKTVTSVTPASNSTSSITVGTTGNGITTTGVTGSATLDSIAMSADSTNKTFTVLSGDAAGMKVKYSGLGENSLVFYGQSLIEKFTSFLDDALSITNGQISKRETTINQEVTDQSALLVDLNKQMENLRSRYISQFTAMEQAVTSLKSTGEYLTNLLDAMNKDD